MAVFTLGQASAGLIGGLAGRAVRRPGLAPLEPVRARRDSCEAGTFEDTFFAVPAKGEPDRLLRIARRTLDAGRQLRREARSGARTLTLAERRIVALTAAAVRVYEEIVTLARLNRGRVFPSYEHLARATALGRATIARALQTLEQIGFLVRRRRFTRIAGTVAGPRIRQTSNVYRPALPPGVLAYLPRWMRPAPTPDDILQHAADRAADVQGMLDTLSCRELALSIADGALGGVLARLGAGIDARTRESQIELQSLLQR